MTLRNTRCHGPAEGTSTSVGPLTVPRLQLCDESGEDTVLPSAVFSFFFFTWFYFLFFLSLCGIPSLFTLQNRDFQASEHVSYLSGTFLKRFSTTCLLQWERLRCEMSHLLPPLPHLIPDSDSLFFSLFLYFILITSDPFFPQVLFSYELVQHGAWPSLWFIHECPIREGLWCAWIIQRQHILFFHFLFFYFFWLAVFHLLSK